MIEINGVNKKFHDTNALNNVIAAISEKSIFGLVGTNGAGKSTTIDLLLGLKKPDCGTGTILGLNPSTNRKAVFERVGVQLQSSNYQNNIRVDELCKEMSALYENPEDYHRLLRLFSLEKFEKSKVNKLSGGERSLL